MMFETKHTQNRSFIYHPLSDDLSYDIKHRSNSLIEIFVSSTKNPYADKSFRTFFPIFIPPDLTVYIEMFWYIGSLNKLFSSRLNSISDMFLLTPPDYSKFNTSFFFPLSYSSSNLFDDFTRILFDLTLSTISIPKHQLNAFASSLRFQIDKPLPPDLSSHLITQFTVEEGHRINYCIYTTVLWER